ncbi:MAG: M28 family peptidase [Verrucomicrobiota bacterium]
MRSPFLSLIFFLAAFPALAESEAGEGNEARLIKDPRQLTFAGKRAGEGYFNADGTKMIFQSEREADNPFYQIYLLDLETGDTNRISPGHGKTTCAWIHPDGTKVMFASTHEDPEAKSDQKNEFRERLSGKARKYSWDYDKDFEIYESGKDGSNMVNLTNAPGYDAEGCYSPDGTKIVFASNRTGFDEDLDEELKAEFERNAAVMNDIYIMDSDGSNVKRLTTTIGYVGGPFFSADGKKICWRRFDRKGATAEIFTMNIDGSDQRQLTGLGAMSWAPYFHPSGDYLIFATNLQGFANFELYLVDAAGQKEPVRVTETEGFDGLPVFSPDGKTISWTSNRTPKKQSQIFMGSWDHELALELLANSPTRESGAGEVGIAANGAVDEASLKGFVEYLASPELKGRLTGTEGERQATEFASSVFRSMGLEPGGDDGTYFDEFEFTAGVDLGENNLLRLSGSDVEWKLNEDWRPLSFSELGTIEPSDVVFAGYGIEVPESTGEDGKKLGMYSSYFHLAVKDKWVMVFRFMPEDASPEVRRRFARHSSLRYKAMTARQKGARGLIIVTGPEAEARSRLVPLGYDASMSGSGLAAISVSDEVASQMLKAAGIEESLGDLQKQLDGGEMAQGFPLGELQVEANIDIVQEKATGRNVLARLKAEGSAEPPLVIGAHIDHLGVGYGRGSRANEDEEGIHYGADDNASGVAGVFEIADYLKGQVDAGKVDLKRDVIFACWSGEELGLLGASHWVGEYAEKHGSEEGKLTGKLSACLNMDMIGRLEKSLVLQGVGSSDYWAPEIEKRNVVAGLPLVLSEDTFISTDATAFYVRGVPILNAFTGAHDDYHTPRDTPDKLDYEDMEKVVKLMALVARGLVSTEEEPALREQENPNDRPRAGLRAYLGTVPDYAQSDVEGVKLSGVGKNGPAEKAGVKGGDIIKTLAGKEVKNIYDYTYVIEALKIGEEIDMEVERGGELLEMKITPESRQ